MEGRGTGCEVLGVGAEVPRRVPRRHPAPRRPCPSRPLVPHACGLPAPRHFQSATKMFVEPSSFAKRLDAQMIFVPSALNIGNPSNLSLVVTCSSPVPSRLTRYRSKLPL